MLFQLFINSKFISAAFRLQFPAIPTYPANEGRDTLQISKSPHGDGDLFIQSNATGHLLCPFHIGAVRVIVLPKGCSNQNDETNLIISKPIDLLSSDGKKALASENQYNQLSEQMEADLFKINEFDSKKTKFLQAFKNKCNTDDCFLLGESNVDLTIMSNRQIYKAVYKNFRGKSTIAYILGLCVINKELGNDYNAEAFIKGIYYIACFPFKYLAEFSLKPLHSLLKDQNDNLIKINAGDLLFFEFSVIPWYREFILSSNYDIKYEFVSSQLFTYQNNMKLNHAIKKDVEIFKKKLNKIKKIPVLEPTLIHRSFGAFIYFLPIIFCIIVYIKYKRKKQNKG